MELVSDYMCDDTMRHALNELTRKTFYFDFEKWVLGGYYEGDYIPYSFVENGKVISNVSVNRMRFDINGVMKNYIQIGTVMTDEKHRGQGLNKRIMELILKEYKDKSDGIYLFGNDSVLNYYPKFGFLPCEEYEYYFAYERENNIIPYSYEKINMEDKQQASRVYKTVKNYIGKRNIINENDAMYMSENVGLYNFWLDSEYQDNVYYLSECGAYIVMTADDDKLYIHQIIGKDKVELRRVAKTFEADFSEVILGYTPADKEGINVRVHKSDDCTLFIMGKDLNCIKERQLIFPTLSHA